jgi:translation elongation factor EF-1beta
MSFIVVFMTHDIQRTLLTKIKRHISRTGTNPTAFGLKVLNDPNLVRDLENGRSPTIKTVERIEAALKGA